MAINTNNLYGIIENLKDATIDLIKFDIPQKTSRLIAWAVTNPEKAIAIGGLVVSFLHASQSLVVSQRVRSENLRRDYTYYDPKTHTRWDLCRRLNNYEKQEILKRRRDGEDAYDILKSMNAIR